jgi:formate hydrogenlyase subunit 3/multisubunit Na+/H+ antiporter MnhD subunit
MNPASQAAGGLILVPLVLASLSFLWPGKWRQSCWAAAALLPPAVVILAWQVVHSTSYRFSIGGWAIPLGIELRADGLSILLLTITVGVGLAVMLYASSYFGKGVLEYPNIGQRYFWPLYFFLLASLNALFLSSDIFNLYVTLELMGFSAVALVALAGKRLAVVAALKYFFVSLGGSLCYLLGVGLTYGMFSTVDLSLLSERVEPSFATWTALFLMTGGLVAKAALFPLHFWLPPAHSNAPSPVSALLSALVVKGSFYIVLRLWFEAFDSVVTTGAALVLGGLGVGAIFWGSYQALLQPRLKLLVAYSTVAQLGYLFLVFPLAVSTSSGFTAWSGCLLFLGAHACAKTAMFLTAGNILYAAGHDRIRDLDGITHVLPLSVFAFALSGISLVGLPPSGGFAGKWLLLNAGLSQGKWFWVAVILVGSLMAAAYIMRVLTHAFTRVEEPDIPNPIPPVMEWTGLTLAVLAILLGLLSWWPIELLRFGAPMVGPAFSVEILP